MADLKTSATSNYPTSLDTFTTIVDGDTRSATPMNGIADAAVKIETALGTNPHGAKQTVGEFVQVGHKTGGTHKSGLLDSVSSGAHTVDENTLQTGKMIRKNAYMSSSNNYSSIKLKVDFGSSNLFGATGFTFRTLPGSTNHLETLLFGNSNILQTSISLYFNSGAAQSNGTSINMFNYHVTSDYVMCRHYSLAEDSTIDNSFSISFTNGDLNYNKVDAELLVY